MSWTSTALQLKKRARANTERGKRRVLAAIVVTGSSSSSTVSSGNGQSSWSTVSVAGTSAQARTIERLKRSGAGEVSIVSTLSERDISAQPSGDDLTGFRTIGEQLRSFEHKRFDAVLIASGEAYIECDLAVLLGSHRAHGDVVSRACDKAGPLDLWIVDPTRFNEGEEALKVLQTTSVQMIEVQGYVNCLKTAGDFRRFVADILMSRCQSRPAAFETRPGVWIAEGAQIARGARVVAPAFVGRGVRVAQDCLITRCSNIESNSYIDFGTAVEDSSILPNTYIGIGLDLSHSIVDGQSVLNLRHNVKLQITDPVVMRRNGSRTLAHNSQMGFEMKTVALSSGDR